MLAVLGAGAVGGLLAALVHRSGADVVLVGRPATMAQIAARGIRVTSPTLGQWTALVPARTQLPAGADVVLTVKAYALPDVLPALAAARPAHVVSLLNGVAHANLLRTALAGSAVTGASITVEVTRPRPGEVEHRSRFIRVAVPAAAADWATTEVLRVAGVDVLPGGSEQEVLWRKFRFLAPLALLTSYWQQALGHALNRDPALTDTLIREMAVLATTEGLPTTPGELSDVLAGLPTGMRSSLQLDLGAGRPTELDAIAGPLVDLADRHGHPAPALRSLTAALRSRVGHTPV